MTKYEIKRETEMTAIKNSNDYCGMAGRIFELENARANSHKIKVSTQGKIDNYVKIIDGNGKAKYVPAESKTNGGRIDELLNGSKAKYVIYRLDYVQKHKAGKKAQARDEHRYINAKIIPTSLFLTKLNEFKAIKQINRNGEFDGYGIQASSKKWFEWLSDYPVDFNKEWTYEAWEFEGLD